MRLLITADPYLPVPPAYYGGIERVIALLVDGLVARGHEVTLLAHPGSRTPAELIPYGIPPHQGAMARTGELVQAAVVAWAARNTVDLVHSFGRLAALAPLLPRRRLPKVQSYQRAVPWRGVARAVRLAGPSVHFTACSSSMYAARPAGTGDWHTVYNAVDLTRYPVALAVEPDAPLMFLGRLERIKGVHHAIAIARGAGRRLVIAGNRVTTPEGEAYFDDEIAPHLDDAVAYVGEVDDEAKARWLVGAAALLMPIEWEEPFGIVMAEALACGTPVIGFARGSVPEVVVDGRTGFVCRTPEEAIASVARLDRIDRAACRDDAARRFSATALIDAYERVYAAALSQEPAA
ncbi:MAG: glycosyltransferase family 4 protein [Vicinamibacterales bacterium]|nr:glycosyltransferase family 4 protein [Vicinamibacterales bacterium]